MQGSHYKVLLLCVLMTFITSCSDKNKHVGERVSFWLGQEVTLPENMLCLIKKDTVDIKAFDADYKIVVYIDSLGCTNCKMKLREWTETMNLYNSAPDTDIDLFMIINAKDVPSLQYILRTYDFEYPVLVDTLDSFRKTNGIENDENFRTFLLDNDNKIVAIGSPVWNPNVRDFYKRTILGDSTDAEGDDIIYETPLHFMLGTSHRGQSESREFRIRNNSGDTLHVSGLIPSCECVTAVTDKDSIAPGERVIATVTLTPDSVFGQQRRFVDLFFSEKEKPIRLKLTLLNTNNQNYEN